MEPRELLNIVKTAERLKDTTRHCYTRGGRHESVAEHSWMITLMAYLLKDSFPDADMDKVIKMCIIHDLGEIFTGDIPTFLKTGNDEDTEDALLSNWVSSLPAPVSDDMAALFAEMNARETVEAKIYKSLDSLEALIQHNLSHLDTWTEHEYELNLTYADDKVAFSEYLSELREEIRKDTLLKIETEKK